MKSTFFNSLLLVLTFQSTVYSQSFCYNDRVSEYIHKYKETAIEQMTLFRIPASVILAQAIKESNYGSSFLAQNSNNHFGIKCHKEWGGDSFNKDDDTLNECFRKYNCIEDSYLDHSLFLASRPRYSFLFTYNILDYKSWCFGLKAAGYATSPPYAFDLVQIIETYRLYELDQPSILPSVFNPSELLASTEKDIIVPASENILADNYTFSIAKTLFSKQLSEEGTIFVRNNKADKKPE